MPLDPKTTKNGVDLNQVDVGQLTLVEKEALLNELSKKLQTDITLTFERAIDLARTDIRDAADDAAAAFNAQTQNSGSSSDTNSGSSMDDSPSQGSGPSAPRSSGGRSQKSSSASDTFEKLRKLHAATSDTMDKLNTIQKKKDKESRIQQLKGNVYSTIGKKAADSINDISSGFHNYSNDRLHAAQEKLSNIQESIQFETVGKEQSLLSAATLKLQEALQKEVQVRSTTMGKIGQYMTKQNIDAVSLITGFASKSPIMGLMTKLAFDAVKSYRENKKKDKNADLKFGDIKKMLPKPSEPEIDDSAVRIDSETLRKHLGKISNADVRHATLENLRSQGKISDEQHSELSSELIPPDFTPLQEQLGSNAPPAPAGPGGGGSTPQSPQLTDHLGNPVRDYSGYSQKTTKKQQDIDTQEGWINYILQHGVHEMRRDHDDRLKREKPADWDEELLGDFYAKPSSLSHLERMQSSRSSYTNPMPFLNEDGSTSNEAQSNAPQPVEPMASPGGAEQVRPRGEGGNVLSNLERLSEQQVHELEKINKLLAKQIEQADLAADAKRRETEDRAAGSGLADQAGLLNHQPKPGAAAASHEGILDNISDATNIWSNLRGRGFRRKFRGIKQVFKGGFGKLKNLFRMGRGAAAVGGGAAVAGEAGALAGGAGAVTGAVGATEAAGGAVAAGGGLLKGMKTFGGGLGKIAGKVGMFAKGIPVIGWVITAVSALVDFIPAFINAEEFLGMKKGQKANIGDRITAGFGGVIKGLFGIVDFVTSLLGFETDLGGFLGHGFANLVQTLRGRLNHALASPHLPSGVTSSRGKGADMKQSTTATPGKSSRGQGAPMKYGNGGVGRGSTPTAGAGSGDAKVIPVSGTVSSLFGNRVNPMTGKNMEDHGAIDIATPVGSPVQVAQDGKVIRANGTDDPNGYGNVIDVMHPDGSMTRYGHLSQIGVSVGQDLKRGEQIGLSGGARGAQGSGRSEGPHLHFEVQKNGRKIDPTAYLSTNIQKGDTLQGGQEVGGMTPSPVQTATAKPLTKSETSPQPVSKDGTAMVKTADLAEHIAQYEGWNEKDAKGQKTNNWAQRNNNPGNIRPTSKDQKQAGGFRVFDTPEEGFAALHAQIEATTAKGLNLQEFFGGKKGVYPGYAPAGDKNDPQKYANYVAQKLGIDPTSQLSLAPKQEGPTLADLDGVKLARASTASTTLARNAAGAGDKSVIVAPSTSTVNQNSSTNVSLRAKNTDTTYQRAMNAQYVPT